MFWYVTQTTTGLCVNCQVVQLAKISGVVRVLDYSGTWVFDRRDAAGKGFRVWYDDAVSLAPKWRAVRDAGWGGVAMWLPNGMFPDGLNVQRPGVFNCYCPDELREMWDSINVNFVRQKPVDL